MTPVLLFVFTVAVRFPHLNPPHHFRLAGTKKSFTGIFGKLEAGIRLSMQARISTRSAPPRRQSRHG